MRDLNLYDGYLCGDAFEGPSGRAMVRGNSQKRMEATEVAGNIVLAGLPNLKSLCVGGQYANITRDVLSGVNVSWPWSGRMMEILYDKWPEVEEDDHLYEDYVPSGNDDVLFDDELEIFEEL